MCYWGLYGIYSLYSGVSIRFPRSLPAISADNPEILRFSVRAIVVVIGFEWYGIVVCGNTENNSSL